MSQFTEDEIQMHICGFTRAQAIELAHLFKAKNGKYNETEERFAAENAAKGYYGDNEFELIRLQQKHNI